MSANLSFSSTQVDLPLTCILRYTDTVADFKRSGLVSSASSEASQVQLADINMQIV